MKRQRKNKTIAEHEMEIETLYTQKSELIKQRIEIENKILKKEGSIIYLGFTYAERLTGHLSKNLTAEKKISILQRLHRVENEGKKPYNKFYSIQLSEKKLQIKQIDGKIAYGKRKIRQLKEKDRKHENEPITAKEFIGKENYSDMSNDERMAFQRAKKRREEELRKMELGLPPYDKIKIKKL